MHFQDHSHSKKNLCNTMSGYFLLILDLIFLESHDKYS